MIRLNAWWGMMFALWAVACPLAASQAAAAKAKIYISADAPAIVRYAADELARYVYQLTGTVAEVTCDPVDADGFVIGQLGQPHMAKLAAEGKITASAQEIGAQGYLLKKTQADGRTLLVIAGGDEVGCLYGVYGLLEDHYGARFYMGGDVLPETRQPLMPASVDEQKRPAAQIRGFLPWTNFPQSATVYSWEDWKFIIDQMARMRMNFLNIHNYNGECGHNEMFHNFELDGQMSRVWMATARTGHGWACPGWDVKEYLFGAGDLFDDYDFGSEAALHNETLSNAQVFRKGVSMFQRVIAYAHSRGVKVGLGLDINLIPKEYNKSGGDPRVAQARALQVANDYPELDYLLCFQSEMAGRSEKFFQEWRATFDIFYNTIKHRSPRTLLAVAGWGLDPKSIATLQDDVICAPISAYSDGCENGSIYGNREYWGCPWLERDTNSSEYYYPYNMHLSNTIKAWQNRAPNMKGFYCLTWRLADAIDPKMWYMARTAWDGDRWTTSEQVYRDYATHNYGQAAADAVTKIINQNEPIASLFGECCGTLPFNEDAGLGNGALFNLSQFSLRAAKEQVGQPVRAADFAQKNGTKNARCSEGGQCVASISAGHWLKFENVDFGAGADAFEARVASATQGGRIVILLDRLDGPRLGECLVQNTGGWQNWTTAAAPIAATSGTHTVYLKFVGRKIEGQDVKADEQIAVVQAAARQATPMQRQRLEWLQCRLTAARKHIELNQKFEGYRWADLPGAMEPWVRNFILRVRDISSLGNVMSVENRYVQLNYLGRQKALRKAMAVQPPSHVEARGLPDGAVVRWRNEQRGATGFNVYRDGKKLTSQPLAANADSYRDRADGRFQYTVTAIREKGEESQASIPSACLAGKADDVAPTVILISPPTSMAAGQRADVEARVLDGRACECLSAELFYRRLGEPAWKKVAMERRVKAIFVGTIPPADVTAAGVEYYVQATDGANVSVYPRSAPELSLTLVAQATRETPPSAPTNLRADKGLLSWSAPAGEVCWYKIYRSAASGFAATRANYVTYVQKDTTSFQDNGIGFDGLPLKGTQYYRVTAVTRGGLESEASAEAAVPAER